MKVKLTNHSPSYRRITFSNPPINLLDQQSVIELLTIYAELKNDQEVKVVVFDSADPNFFMAHYDVLEAMSAGGGYKLGPDGLTAWSSFTRELENAPFITIGLVRGRARGVGSEILQALDMRFASTEKAIFGQLEVGTGLIPGGGGLERLPLLLGRARALEVALTSQDYNADLAERYGWINRSIPDVDLDEFVNTLAMRVASFDRDALLTTKRIINHRSLMPTTEGLNDSQYWFYELLQKPEVKERYKFLFEAGFQQSGPMELNMGEFLGTYLQNK